MDDIGKAGPDVPPVGRAGKECLRWRVDEDAGGEIEDGGSASGGEMDGGPEFIGPKADFGDLVKTEGGADCKDRGEDQNGVPSDTRLRGQFEIERGGFEVHFDWSFAGGICAQMAFLGPMPRVGPIVHPGMSRWVSKVALWPTIQMRG